MKNLFKPGDEKQLRFIVSPGDVARFTSGVVHEVYSTFSLARDAEWTTRQFVLEMKEADEEGIGTMISVVHHSPALVGQEVVITSHIKAIRLHEIICEFSARVGNRLIASGETRQKILKQEKFKKLFAVLTS